MSARWPGSRIFAVVVAVCVAAVITLAMLSAFLFDRFDAYGEVPIPGESTVYLPAGPASISFHARTSGRGTTLPPLTMEIEPPRGEGS